MDAPVREGGTMSQWTHRIAAGAALGLALAWAVSCAAPGNRPESIPEVQRAAYAGALARLDRNPGEGRAALESFLAQYPGSSLADDALLRLAEDALASGRSDDGRRWLGTILTQYPGSDGEPVARLRLAEIEYARDRRTAARSLLAPVELRRLAGEQARAALRLRVSLAQTPVERLENLARLRAALQDATGAETGSGRSERDAGLVEQRDAVDRDLAAAIARAATPELIAAQSALDRRSPAGAIALELASRAIDAGDLEQAERHLDRAVRLAEGPAEQAALEALEARLAQAPPGSPEPAAATAGGGGSDIALASLRALSEYTRVDTLGAEGTLGVVLPLTGDFADFGEASLRGILLAAGVFEIEPDASTGLATDGAPVSSSEYESEYASGGGRPNVLVVVRDSAGDPARAAAAVRELAARDDVRAIVGPIFSDEAAACAEAAEQERIPLVTLSNREDVVTDRRYVVRIRTTPGDEVSVLVDHAFENLSARRFGVLYPQTRYGRGMRKLYWDAVVARGGHLVAMASYAPEETDFANVIKEMVGFRFLSGAERQAIAVRDGALEAARSLPPAQAAAARRAAYAASGPEGDPLPPIVDFDVLFIPDSAEAVAMIAPGLALHGVRDVRLLGSSDWLDADLLRGADRHVAGAVISTPFFAESDVGVVRDFVTAFHATFDAAPDAYAAQGFDAANLVMQQLVGRGRDRESIREGLLDVRAFPGASGSLTMLPDGNARRRPFLVEARGQRFVPLD